MQVKEALVIHRKEGDAGGDALIFQLKDSYGNPVPIPEDREAFLYFKRDCNENAYRADFANLDFEDSPDIQGAMTFEEGDREAGKLRYQFTEEDLRRHGRYIGFIRTFFEEDIETFPHTGYIVLYVERDISA